MEQLSFSSFNLSAEILKAIENIGYEKATPIQALAIPALKEGHDVIGQAQTGTGKTAAFGIPILEHIDTLKKQIQALILCPTRELAIQVAEEMQRLGLFKKGLNILPIYGGQPIERQLKALKTNNVNVVVGTPGRVNDHINRGTINLDNVRMFALDEADEMLDMGFRDELEAILNCVSETSQKILFSATMSPEILELAKTYLKNPKLVKVEHKQLTVENIEQYYLEIGPRDKFEALCRLIDVHNPQQSLIFCNTKRKVDELVEHLHKRGYFAVKLHGDMKQSARDRVMEQFRGGSADILVATDVAARGIDVEHVEAVFNFDIPHDEEDYVHRIGRTGRAGRTGKAFTFVVGREIKTLKTIGRYIKAFIAPIQIPTTGDVSEQRTNKVLDKIKAVLQAGQLEQYQTYVEKLLNESTTSLDVAAALFKIAFDKKSSRATGEQPSTSSSEETRRPRQERSFGQSQDRPQRRYQGGGEGRSSDYRRRSSYEGSEGKSSEYRPRRSFQEGSHEGHGTSEYRPRRNFQEGSSGEGHGKSEYRPRRSFQNDDSRKDATTTRAPYKKSFDQEDRHRSRKPSSHKE